MAPYHYHQFLLCQLPELSILLFLFYFHLSPLCCSVGRLPPLRILPLPLFLFLILCMFLFPLPFLFPVSFLFLCPPNFPCLS